MKQSRLFELAGITAKTQETMITEASLARSIENWMDATKSYSFEGPRGIKNFTSLIRVIGYKSLDDFLEDNSGVLEAMIGWIGKQRIPEWTEKLAEFADKDED